ncbi:hypothetical protein [Pseudooceanicola sp. 200-1SW]|uniref:hypothetical protein n=1 Tax=Pseudooceanicola sp. 200-1SW TaxID=3425949 RepID=UPI003D7F78BB
MYCVLLSVGPPGEDFRPLEAYEAAVLPVLAAHGGERMFCLRHLDTGAETHLYAFPDEDSYDRYLADPRRAAARAAFDRAGISAVFHPVVML